MVTETRETGSLIGPSVEFFVPAAFTPNSPRSGKADGTSIWCVLCLAD
jgi:hypothetical protein